MESNLIIVEENDTIGLRLFSYHSCCPEDPHDIKINRSVVLDNTGTVITKSLPYTTEIENLDDEKLNNIDWSEYDICPSIEGTLLRVFHFNGKWIISTNRKLDAFSSYWSSRLSFGQLFLNHLLELYPNQTNHALEYFHSKLDENNTYFFLVQSNYENRVVCNVADPKLYYVGKYVGKDYSVLHRGDFDTIPTIDVIPKDNINNSQDIIDYITGCVVPFETQGLLLFHKSRNEQIKVYHPEYRRYWKIRNNVPNLQLRYLQLRLTSRDDLSQFFALYPKFRPTADSMENTILAVSRFIYDAYVNRFIRKQYVSIPREMYHILKMAHEWHTQDRTHNKIYFHKVISFVNEQDPVLLLTIIRKFCRRQSTERVSYSIPIVQQPVENVEQVV